MQDDCEYYLKLHISDHPDNIITINVEGEGDEAVRIIKFRNPSCTLRVSKIITQPIIDKLNGLV